LSNETHIRAEELELHALGALTETEAAAVAAHVSGCAECRKELAEARGRAALLAFSVAQEKPEAGVKEKLLARIREEKGGLQAAGERKSLHKDLYREKKRGGAWWNWVLLPLTAALALLSVLLWQQNQSLTKQLQVAMQSAAELERARLQVLGLLNVLASPKTITVRLAGSGETEGARGLVKYNKESGEMVYSAELPALPADKVYQMWLLPVEGAPISAGIFTRAEAEKNLYSAKVPAMSEAKAFAVTIEPAGGVASPTGPKVLVGLS
jgi:anti-sigma-K factor RskA